jgi:hypothetical protein
MAYIHTYIDRAEFTGDHTQHRIDSDFLKHSGRFITHIFVELKGFI